MATDFYQVLGVQRNASSDAIKKAYRVKAREFHPDSNPDDPQAEERFKEVARAYEVLSDPDSRARYDRYGEDGLSGAGMADGFGAGGLGDLFGSIFGDAFSFTGGAQSGPPRGQDIEAYADISLAHVITGGAVPVEVRTAVRCDDCNGSGAGEGTKPVSCSDCAGTGQQRRVRNSMLGQMITTSPCQRCGGIGEVVVTPCKSCGGDGRKITNVTYQVDIPAGVDTGQTLRLSGCGAVGPRGGGTGDLYVHARVARDEIFSRDGFDLVTVLPISFAQAVLGLTMNIDTFDGEKKLTVPKGTQPHTELVLPGLGIPRLNQRGRAGGRGDLRVIVTVEVPTKPSAEELELITRLAELNGDDTGDGSKSLIDRLKRPRRD